MSAIHDRSGAWHPAPWGIPLIVVSVLATLLCTGVAVLTALHTPADLAWLAWLPLLVPLACAPFVVRGYRVEGRVLRIRRLWWDSEVSLRGLSGARHDPAALRRSIRLWGNGGLFSFTGWFRNGQLGTYRAYLTDPKRAVVLRIDRRVVVVSPANPAAFLRELEPAAGPDRLAS